LYKLCSYCYAKAQKNKFLLDMAPEDFDNILDWFIGFGADEIIFVGGEPTLHPLFEDFLDIIAKKKVLVRLFSNGSYDRKTGSLISANEYIKTLFFHYEDKYISSSVRLKVRFFSNLEQAGKSNKKIWLRWNINSLDIDDSAVIALARRFSVRIGYSILMPTSLNNEVPITEVHRYASILIHLVESVTKHNNEIEPARALPFCSFSEEQIRFFEKKRKPARKMYRY